MNLPTPNTVIGKAIERALLVALVAFLGALLNNSGVSEGSLLYFGLKTAYDLLNANTPTR